MEIGPGAGAKGGQLVVSGTPKDLIKQNTGKTAAYLKRVF
jgi:excinuclease UvrABC ATPase subunit